MRAPLDSVHRGNVVLREHQLLAGAHASPITMTQAIAATAESHLQRRITTAAMVNVSNVISALEIVFARS
jgi:hypothetical protein